MFNNKEINNFISTLPCKKGVLGYSEFGQEIVWLHIGKNEGNQIIISASIHARESITAYLVLKQAEYLINKQFDGGVYFLPCINPDGVDIASGKTKPPSFFEGDHTAWKANGRGVDLNVNFDARWGEGKSNVFYPNHENYVGAKPFSESETRALRDFTLDVMPSMTISYHTKGREIYFDFYQQLGNYERDEKIAKKINERLQYRIVTGLESAGGYKDWCVQHLKIPSYTIEIGDDALVHPLNKQDIAEDLRRNIDLPLHLSKWV